MRTLYGLSYSPWTEKARWALDHHRIAHRYVEHLPLVGTPWLRLKSGKTSGRVTVPFLEGEGEAISGSIDIARHVDALGRGTSLFPEGRSGPIVDLDTDANEILDVARALVIERTKADPDVQREAVPGFVPGFLRGASMPLTRVTAGLLARRYDAPKDAEAKVESVVLPRLAKWQDQLGDAEYFLGSFSYADVTTAVTLQCVEPVADAHMKLGPATRRAWTMPKARERFPGLLAWRDRMYARHRRG